jgi:hypothetical protein
VRVAGTLGVAFYPVEVVFVEREALVADYAAGPRVVHPGVGDVLFLFFFVVAGFAGDEGKGCGIFLPGIGGV